MELDCGTGARDYDVVVLGSGAAGLTAALVAAIEGLRAIVIEKSPWIGGTTALSAGSVWVPNTHLAPDAEDNPENARRYLDAIVGNHASAALKTAFLSRVRRRSGCSMR